MTYNPTNWKDRIIEKPNTFNVQENSDGTVTLIPVTGQVLQQGTPLNAQNLNKIEQGLVETNSQLAQTEQVINSKIGLINHIKADKNEVRLIENKIEPEDVSDRLLGLVTGDGSINLESIPQNNSVSEIKLDVELQKSLISTLKNEIPDPLFEGTSWYPVQGQLETENGVLTATGNGNQPYFGAVHPARTIIIDAGDKVYFSLSVITDSEKPNRIQWAIQELSGNLTLDAIILDDPSANSLYKLSGVYDSSKDLAGINLLALAFYNDAGVSHGKKLKIYRPLLINLTKVFGAGNEPAKEVMDNFLENLNTSAWIKDTASLNEISLLHFKQISDLITKQNNNERRINELEDLVSSGSGGISKCFTLSHAPTPELIDFVDLGWTMTGTEIIEPYWIENYNDSVRIIGYYNSQLYQSLDNAQTWTRILGGGLLNGRPDFVFCVNNPNFDKTVMFVKNGVVYQSTDLQNNSISTWVKVLDGISSGDLTFRYGRSIHGNMVLLSTYHTGYDSTGQNPARFIYLSKDYGSTFDEIELPNHMIKDPFQFHIHDVEYDPQLKRIWLSIGDQANSGLYYSDDFGVTWTEIPDAPIRPTNITSLPHITLFATDDRPTAIYGYKKFIHRSSELVKWEDFEMLSDPIEDILLIANLNMMDVYSSIDRFPFTLVVPFEGSQSTDYPPIIYCSPDGVSWETLLRLDEVDTRFKNGLIGRVMGVASNDPDRMCYIAVYHSEIGSKLIKLKMPEWIEIPFV